MRISKFLGLLLGLSVFLTACEDGQRRHITILATNDIHGGIEPSTKNGESLGGMAFWGGVIRSIKKGINKQYGWNGGVLVVDGGDQFQGTLLSNYNEGSLVFRAMDVAGYDAVVPGNHNYDFGPKGWLEDKVISSSVDQNPRGVIEGLARHVDFPLLSANTFLKSSLRSSDGTPVDVNSIGCKPLQNNSPAINWQDAKAPRFLKPYVIREVAGVRIALIGIDNATTPSSTTRENVDDLCFDNELSAYQRMRQKLEAKADIFVMVIHNGDVGKETNASTLTAKLLEWNPRAVDVVIAGHTHYTHNLSVQGVPVIQSGANGEAFGRVDLVWNAWKRKLEKAATKSFAGIKLWHQRCDANAASFCENSEDGLKYDGIRVKPSEKIAGLIAGERARIAPFAGRKLAIAAAPLTIDRINESPLADALTDAFRHLANTDISFLNTGGIRTSLPTGDITYEALYRVMPFGNRGLVVGPMPWSRVRALLERSIATCGTYGALMQSGLLVEFSRNCGGSNGLAVSSQLERVSSVEGEVFFDRTAGFEVAAEKTFQVATLDFLAAGGSGYVEFAGTPLVRDMGIFREALADALASQPAVWNGGLDGRWQLRAP